MPLINALIFPFFLFHHNEHRTQWEDPRLKMLGISCHADHTPSGVTKCLVMAQPRNLEL